jgi:DNA-binding LacI/PurR family transcriptional regulator
MRAEAAALGMALDVRLVNEHAVTLEMIEKQIERTRAGGVLLAGIDAWDELADWAGEAEIGVVLVNGSDPQMRINAVSPANFYGAYQATQRLLNAGHRRILHFTNAFRPTILERRRGFEAAIAATPDAVGVVVNTAETSTKDLLGQLLTGKHDVTALFSWNDIAAVEMLDMIYSPYSPLPKEFSIIGFDDLPIADMATPRLSTMRVDREAIGRGAVRLLAQQMDGDPQVQELQIGVSQIEGATVFPLRP